MDVILVEVTVKPEKMQEFLELIKYDAEHSEKDEPGCLRFDVLQDTEDPNKFFYYEVYRDEAARMAHRETPHYKHYAEKSPELFGGPVSRRILRNVIPDDAAWR